MPRASRLRMMRILSATCGWREYSAQTVAWAAAETMAEHWLCSLSEAFRRAVLEMARAREALLQRSLDGARERR